MSKQAISNEVKWIFPQEEVGDTLLKELAEATGVSPIVVKILYHRGLRDPREITRFLSSDLKHLHDPNLLPGIEAAVKRILQAREQQESVVVYGDYDCDGITSTYTLLTVLRAMGIKADYYLPNRLEEGYGLNQGAISRLAKKYSLLITVDTGITACQEVAAAVNQGLDVIITDHHTPAEELPKATAVINPKIKESRYPFPDLAGVGVAYKVALALWSSIAPAESFPASLPLVMLGTVADIVPLVDENRIIVAQGLQKLPDDDNLGLQALVQLSGKDSGITAGHIGFNLAPRINAAGRLGQADLALELFLTQDPLRAKEIARHLTELNSARQSLEEEILQQAIAQVEKTFQPEDKVIVVAGEGWHSGVIGIVASRLVELYFRPAIVITFDGDQGHGSARSYGGLNIFEALTHCTDVLLGFGGHSGAAGLSLTRDMLAEFRQRLAKVVDQLVSYEDLVPQLTIEAEASLPEITEGLVKDFQSLEPYGCGNPRPIIALKNADIQDVQKVGREQTHLKLRVAQGGVCLDAIGFNLADRAEMLEKYCGQVQIAFYPEINEWQGRRSLQLQIKDIKIPKADLSFVDELFLEQAAAATDPYASIGDAQEFYTKVVGVTFDGRQQVVSQLKPGQELLLNRERDNPYDPNAVAIITQDGTQIGYLRRGIARHLAPLIDENTEYKISVSSVTGGAEGQSLGVNLFLRKKEDPEEYLAWVEGRENRRVLSQLAQADLKEAIREAIIGKYSYHQKQLEALSALEAGKNTLLIMGTGRGKSAVFQSMAAYKALACRQITVVIYPLRALVNDQYRSMQTKLAPLGIRVLKATGSLTTREREELNTALYLGEAEVILATPEFVQCNLAQHSGLVSRLGLFVVDESHHIGKLNSQRSGYRNLDRLRTQLGNPLTLAVTATADDQVAGFIKDSLAIEEIVIDPHRRDNLSIIDKRGLAEDEKLAYLLDLVPRREKSIIYVNSREGATKLAHDLRKAFLALKDEIAFYHGRLTNGQRIMVEEMFREDLLRTVVSTSAFGEGVDIPDIRHVIHYHLTFNFTDFNQQSGRAGRDGKPAQIHLLYNQEDADLNRFILKSKAPEREILGALYRVLERNMDERRQVTLSNAELAEIMVGYLRGGDYFRPSSDTVSAGLGVLYELGLLERERTGGERLIYLGPRPQDKLDLNASVRYNEGIVEKEAFEEFQEWALTATREEILSLVNKPIYPGNL